MTTPNDTLYKPNWPGGPTLCRAEGLPAFEDNSAMRAFIKRNCPSVRVSHTWRCTFCGHFHFESDLKGHRS